eukprot:334082_1
MALFFGKPSKHHRSETSKQIYKDISKDIKKIEKNQKYSSRHRKESILTNLPSYLKQHANTIYTMNQFWLDNIKILTDEELNHLAMFIYCSVYNQSSPKARELLLQSNKMNIPSHTLKIFTIFEYFLTQIIDSNTDIHNKLLQKLHGFGEIHKTYLNDMDCDIYQLLINAFNDAFEQQFNKLFTSKIKFCFNQFIRLIIDIMNGNYSTGYVSKHLKQIDIFLQSLEDCLCDEYGSMYFRKHLEQQFCAENYLFWKQVQKYKSAANNQRTQIGRNIINVFIKQNSEMQVNIHGSTRMEILNIIEIINNDEDSIYNINISAITEVDVTDFVQSKGFIKHLFDKAQKEIYLLMRRNNWFKFRNEILKDCSNDNFKKQQQNKVSEKHKEFAKKRQLYAAIVASKNDNDEEKQLEKLKKHNRELTQQIETLKLSNVVAQLDVNVDDKNTDDEPILSRQFVQNQLSEQIDALKLNTDIKKLEIDRGKQIINQLKGRANELENDVRDLEDENVTLTQINLTLEQRIMELKKTNDMTMDELKENNIKLQNIIQSKIQLAQSTATEIDSLRAKIKLFTEEIADTLTNV